MSAEEAFDFLVHHLSAVGLQNDFRRQRVGVRGCDLYLPDVARAHAIQQMRNRGERFIDGHDTVPEEAVLPLYDAAWELCRLGVLRPGMFAPMGAGLPPIVGDQYVITAFGFEWLQRASQRAFIDISRLGTTLVEFAPKFGDGYGMWRQVSRSARACSTMAQSLAHCWRVTRRASCRGLKTP
jgi:hypothetical protein